MRRNRPQASSSSRAKPSMLTSGARRSWEVARKMLSSSDLRSPSARSRRVMSRSSRLRSEMSSSTSTPLVIAPEASRMGAAFARYQRLSPSLRRSRSSMLRIVRPSRMATRSGSSSGRMCEPSGLSVCQPSGRLSIGSSTTCSGVRSVVPTARAFAILTRPSGASAMTMPAGLCSIAASRVACRRSISRCVRRAPIAMPARLAGPRRESRSSLVLAPASRRRRHSTPSGARVGPKIVVQEPLRKSPPGPTASRLASQAGSPARSEGCASARRAIPSRSGSGRVGPAADSRRRPSGESSSTAKRESGKTISLHSQSWSRTAPSGAPWARFSSTRSRARCACASRRARVTSATIASVPSKCPASSNRALADSRAQSVVPSRRRRPASCRPA